MIISVADLCDQFSDKLHIAADLFRSFGGRWCFNGVIETVRIDEDNRPVIALLEQQGNGRILVVDNQAIRTCAVVGDRLAGIAQKNGWSGIVINGCVRDTETLRRINVGILALGTSPIRSAKRAEGMTGIPVTFAGITFCTGDYLYADPDGVVVSETPLIENIVATTPSIHPVFTETAPQPNGHYSQAVVHDGLAFLSMQLPINPQNPAAPHGSIEQQTEQVITNIQHILEAAGSSLAHTLRVTIYVTDIAHWDIANVLFTARFGAHKPARGVIALPALHRGYSIAMDAVAAIR